MSKKFEYELTLRLEKAEKSIASLAAKIEKDLGKAVETAFRGASEFDVVKFSKNIGSRIEQDVSSALKSAFSGSSEFDFGKRIAAGIEKDVSQAVKTAFSGSSEFDFADPGKAEQAAEEASRKRIQQLRADSETRNQVADEDYQREIQRTDGVAAHLAEKRKEAEAAVAQENQDMASRASQRDKLEEAHTSRLSKNSALLKEYYATYKDPSALNAIQTVEKSLERHSESLKSSGLSLTEQKKVHDDYTKSKLDALDKLTGKEQKATSDRIAQIRDTEAADAAARQVRYTGHSDVLKAIEEAEKINAQQLMKLEQDITGMTEREAKSRIDAYKKMAKAQIDHAVDAGYKMEALTNQQAAAGARGVSSIFQIQQAVEDSMYAGLRGAGNNIAFLLTSISNQWVAIGGLIGIATLQLAEHLGVFDKINESMDGMLWKTKEQIREEEELARLRKEGFDRELKDQIRQATFSPKNKTIPQAQDAVNDQEQKLQKEKERLRVLEIAVTLYEKIEAKAREVRAAEGDPDLLGQKFAEYAKLVKMFNDLKTNYSIEGKGSFSNPFGPSVNLSGGGITALKNEVTDFRSKVADGTKELQSLNRELGVTAEASNNLRLQENIQKAALQVAETTIENARDVVNLRKEELQTIQQTISAAEAALRTEERRVEAIREAASARKDEAAKQELGLKNTLLDMEANEKAKAAKDKAQSDEQNIREQVRRARQWAEQQAKVDKFNNKAFSKTNPQINFDIDEQKAKWLQGLENWEKAQLDSIKKTEQTSIDSAKKVAEEAKKANLDAMEASQKQKVDALKAEADQQVGQGKFGDAQSTLDKAEKALKELANAKVANLNQKDSVAQGEAALKDWQEVQKQLEQLDAKKEEVSNKAQEANKAFIAQEKAREEKALKAVEDANAGLKQALDYKKQMSGIPLISDADEAGVAAIVRQFERLVELSRQIVLPTAVPSGPLMAPQMGPTGTGGAGVGGGVGGAPPTTPGPQFNMNFSMGSATPNAVAAAASSIVQTQKTLAMLGGN